MFLCNAKNKWKWRLDHSINQWMSLDKKKKGKCNLEMLCAWLDNYLGYVWLVFWDRMNIYRKDRNVLGRGDKNNYIK